MIATNSGIDLLVTFPYALPLTMPSTKADGNERHNRSQLRPGISIHIFIKHMKEML
ncbi:MAG: hypothetical protein WCW35_03855 [Bacteroidota bacterium]|jgi:hypothetical protein